MLWCLGPWKGWVSWWGPRSSKPVGCASRVRWVRLPRPSALAGLVGPAKAHFLDDVEAPSGVDGRALSACAEGLFTARCGRGDCLLCACLRFSLDACDRGRRVCGSLRALGQRPRVFARHKQSSGLFVSGLSPPDRAPPGPPPFTCVTRTPGTHGRHRLGGAARLGRLEWQLQHRRAGHGSWPIAPPYMAYRMLEFTSFTPTYRVSSAVGRYGCAAHSTAAFRTKAKVSNEP